jgi:hypothetical protein
MIGSFADVPVSPSSSGTSSRMHPARVEARRLEGHSSWALLFAATAALLLASCGGSASLANRGNVEQKIGRATYNDIMTEVPLALRRYGYAIYNNRETSRTLYIESSWQGRAPFDDEAALGANMARTRFIARARLAGPKIYTLQINAENQLQGVADVSGPQDSGGWATIPATEMYRAYVTEIMTEIKLKVDAGLRTYDGA